MTALKWIPASAPPSCDLINVLMRGEANETVVGFFWRSTSTAKREGFYIAVSPEMARKCDWVKWWIPEPEMPTICNRCRQNEAREGMKSCEPCGVKAATNMQRVRVTGGADYKQRQAVWKRDSFTRRRPLMVAAGICLHCQCKPSKPGLLTCQTCLDATKASAGRKEP